MRLESRLTYFIAFAIFSLTAIFPIVYMLGHFVIKVCEDSSLLGTIFTDSRQLVLLGRSFWLAVSVTFVSLVIGLPVSYVLAADDLPCRKWLLLLVIIPVLIPPYIMSGAWIHLLSPDSTINTILVKLFGPNARLSMFCFSGCVWTLGVSFFPIVAVIVGTGIAKIDRNLQDVARLSTNWWGVFRHSTFIQILPHLAASICLVMIFVLGRYGVPSLLGVNTYPVEIFAQFSAFYDENAAVGISLPLVALVIVLILLQRKFMSHHSYVSIAPSSESAGAIRLASKGKIAIAAILLLFVVTTVLPFFSVAGKMGSLTSVLQALNSASESIVTTSVLAVLAAIISTLIAWPIAKILANRKDRTAVVLDIICWLPIAIPGTIMGLGFVKLGSAVPLIRNCDSFGFLLLLCYIGMFAAFPIRILEASFKRSDVNVRQSAMLDCIRWHQRLLHVDLPIHAPAIAASILMVFVLVIGELNATVLLIPPGKATLAVTIDNLLHYGANATASVLCLTEAMFVTLAVAGGMFICSALRRRI